MMCRKIIFILCGVVLFCGASSVAFATDKNIATGATITDGKITSVPTISAETLLEKIEQGKGKVVVVNIFASWCPPCRIEVPQLKEIREQFSEDELVFIGVSLDKSPQALYTFMEQMEMNYLTYLALDGFEHTVGVTAIPQMLIYNKKGDLVINQKGLMPQESLVKALQRLVKQ